MKEQIQKLAGLNQEVVDLIKEEKMDDAVEKLAEIQELTKEMDEQADAPADPSTDGDAGDNWENKEEIEKAEKIEKAMEMLEKYASLNIGAETIKDLMDQFGALKDQMTAGQETIVKLTERLETVEKAKGISKQADEKKIEKSWSDVWGDLNIL